MNPHTNQAAQAKAETICDFLNQRFGYRYGLELALEAHGVPADMIEVMSNLARNRRTEEFKDLLRATTKNKEPA